MEGEGCLRLSRAITQVFPPEFTSQRATSKNRQPRMNPTVGAHVHCRAQVGPRFARRPDCQPFRSKLFFWHINRVKKSMGRPCVAAALCKVAQPDTPVASRLTLCPIVPENNEGPQAPKHFQRRVSRQRQADRAPSASKRSTGSEARPNDHGLTRPVLPMKAFSITSPIGCHAVPSNCTRRICLIGWKSVDPVLIVMPGSTIELW
jgi:hypothetical protein